jgi:hypothetical protein
MTNPIVAMSLSRRNPVLGTFVGYQTRHALVFRAHVPDIAVAIAEDVFAVAGSLLIVSHVLERLPCNVYLLPAALTIAAFEPSANLSLVAKISGLACPRFFQTRDAAIDFEHQNVRISLEHKAEHNNRRMKGSESESQDDEWNPRIILFDVK